LRARPDMTARPVEVVPVEGLPEVRPGDDLAAMLSVALPDLRSGDVLAVTQKIVSKAEGRVVPEGDGHDAWVAGETKRGAWRRGLVNVAIGCAGLPALVDLRGTKDHHGHLLEATVVALADEVAAASGLVMAKDTMVPAAIVRGLSPVGPPSGVKALVRPPEEDMFRESPLQSIHARRSIR